VTWVDRLLPEITLISPSGIVFTADWSGNSRSMEKRLGVFEYPKRQGAVVQDLEVGAVKYPLTLNFEGSTNDITAGRFFEACKEHGPWTVQHPVRGVKSLQLVSVTEEIQPITSGNITVVETEWIEIDNVQGDVPIPELAATIIQQTGDTQTKHVEYVQTALMKSTLAELKNNVTSAANSVMQKMATLKQTSAEINAQMESVHRGITSTINSTGMSLASLAGQIQTLVTLPGAILTSVATTFDYYAEMLTDYGTDDPVIGELIATSALTVMVQATTDGEVTTREEAIELSDMLRNGFIAMTDRLESLGPDTQIAVFNDNANAVSQAINLLLRRSYDLLTAKRITLKLYRSPVEIAITENVDFDYFISSNQLKGDEILLLPPGREVVVYQ